MAGKAHAIPYGGNELNYIMGESKKKDKPEDIHRVCNNHFANHLNADGMWVDLRLHCEPFLKLHPKMQNGMLKIIYSPAKENTVGFTMKDWEKLAKVFIAVFDSIEITKDDKVISPKTNLANSKYTCYLHLEAESGIPHLHFASCRFDIEGNVNNDHCIAMRYQDTINILAKRHGWQTTEDIHEQRRKEISADCYKILDAMERFNINDYFKRLEALGYEVHARPNEETGDYYGYSIVYMNGNFKASKLGKARELTVPKLYGTWEKRRNEREQRKPKPVTTTAKPTPKPFVSPEGQHQKPTVQRPVKPFRDYTKPFAGSTPFDFHHDHADHTYYIPQEFKQMLEEAFPWHEYGNWQELQEACVMLVVDPAEFAASVFTALIDGATTVAPSSGGGVGQSESGWGRKDDEDECAFMHRTINMIHKRMPKRPRSRGRGM